MNEELVMYLLIRTDLKMSKGKIVAQCGHAVQELIVNCPESILKMYLRGAYPKISLKINDLEEMENIIEACKTKGILYHKVVDAGRTQVEPNTPTILGIGPVQKKNVTEITGNLKLL